MGAKKAARRSNIASIKIRCSSEVFTGWSRQATRRCRKQVARSVTLLVRGDAGSRSLGLGCTAFTTARPSSAAFHHRGQHVEARDLEQGWSTSV